MQKKGGREKRIAKMAIRAMSNFLSQRKQKPLDEASLEKKKNDPFGIVVSNRNGGGVGI